MPHRGSHPWNYHDWVFQNMELADQAARAQFPADADKAQRTSLFVELFEKWVTKVVEKDPTIVKAGCWKCQPNYKWR
jgi:hypothetical protein